MKKTLCIARRLLIGLVMLQLLNLSICSESYWEYYNYSTHVNSYDPTETLVEWVVELKKGNQDAFSYNNSINLKGLCKAFTWHIDLYNHFQLRNPVLTWRKRSHPLRDCRKLSSDNGDILSPPPEAHPLS